MNEFDIEIENEIFKKVYPLDREIFMLFCKIDRYKDKMIEPLYQYMAKMHFLLYKNEMEKATEKYLMDRKKERYEYESRDSIFAPEKRGIFHRRNKAAKLIDKKVLQDWDEYFEEAKKLLYKTKYGGFPSAPCAFRHTTKTRVLAPHRAQRTGRRRTTHGKEREKHVKGV